MQGGLALDAYMLDVSHRYCRQKETDCQIVIEAVIEERHNT